MPSLEFRSVGWISWDRHAAMIFPYRFMHVDTGRQHLTNLFLESKSHWCITAVDDIFNCYIHPYIGGNLVDSPGTGFIFKGTYSKCIIMHINQILWTWLSDKIKACTMWYLQPHSTSGFQLTCPKYKVHCICKLACVCSTRNCHCVALETTNHLSCGYHRHLLVDKVLTHDYHVMIN